MQLLNFLRSIDTKVLILFFILLAELSVCLIIFWPGSMSVDSNYQMSQAIAGLYEDSHHPIMSFVMRVMNHLLLPGSQSMLVFHLFTFFGGLFLLSLYVKRYNYFSALLVVFLGATPAILGNIGVIWKDVGLVTVSVFAIGFFVQRRFISLWLRWTIFFVCLVYIAGVRHNAAVAILPMLFFALYSDFWQQKSPTYRMSMSLLFTCLVLVSVVIANDYIKNTYLKAQKKNFVQSLMLYDLSMYHVQSQPVNFPKEFLVDGEAIQRLKKNGVDKRCHDRNYHGNKKVFVLSQNPTASENLFNIWFDRIANEPELYMKHRWEMFKSLLNWGYSPCRPHHFAIKKEATGIRSEIRNFLIEKVDTTTKTFWFSPSFWTFAAIFSILLHLVGIFFGRDLAMLGVVFGLTGLFYLLPYYFVSLCCDFRYVLHCQAFSYLSLALLPVLFVSKKQKEKFSVNLTAQCWTRRLLLILLLASFVRLAMSFGTANVFRWPFSRIGSFSVLDAKQDWGVMGVINEKTRPLWVDGKLVSRGLRTHANSKIELKNIEARGHFSGFCGFPDTSRGNKIKCLIKQKGKILYESDFLTGDPSTQSFSVKLDANLPLVLEVRTENPGYIAGAHAVWAFDE